MDRHYWSRHISRLDPATEYEQIYRILVSHEFPWDLNQSLSFALYRTYAVPSIGHLLSQTGEFTERTQKRYDDTALILDTVLEHGLSQPCHRIARARGGYANRTSGPQLGARSAANRARGRARVGPRRPRRSAPTW